LIELSLVALFAQFGRVQRISREKKRKFDQRPKASCEKQTLPNFQRSLFLEIRILAS